MKKIIDFSVFFFGLVTAVFFTLFYIQNRVLVPVRLTFNQPALCLLPLVVLVSITIGMILSGIFILSCRLSKSSSPKANTLPSKKETSSVKDDSTKLPDNSTILNKTGGLAETYNPKTFDSKENYRISPNRSVGLDLENENSNANDNSFYVEYEKCKKEIDDLFKSIQNKAQLS